MALPALAAAGKMAASKAGSMMAKGAAKKAATSDTGQKAIKRGCMIVIAIIVLPLFIFLALLQAIVGALQSTPPNQCQGVSTTDPDVAAGALQDAGIKDPNQLIVMTAIAGAASNYDYGHAGGLWNVSQQAYPAGYPPIATNDPYADPSGSPRSYPDWIKDPGNAAMAAVAVAGGTSLPNLSYWSNNEAYQAFAAAGGITKNGINWTIAPKVSDGSGYFSEAINAVNTLKANLAGGCACPAGTAPAGGAGSGGSVPPVGSINSAADFAKVFLTDIGVPVTQQNTIAIEAWTQAEDPWATVVQTHNPMNTTQDEPGATSRNSAGVKSYPNWQEGVQANVTTITNGMYGNIMGTLKAGNDAVAVANAVGASPWGTNGALMVQIIKSMGGGGSAGGTGTGGGGTVVTNFGSLSCCNANATGGGGGSGGAVSAQQTAYARMIIGIAKTMNMGSQGELIGLMVGLDESGLQEYANSNVPISLTFPHTAVGSDHGSVGIFQQQVNPDGSDFGWGTVQQLMNAQDGVDYQAYRFFHALQGISGWQGMQPWVAAQAVQRSGTASGANYQAQMGTAQSILSANADAPAVPLPAGATTGTGGGGSNTTDCSGSGSIDGCQNPIHPGLYGPSRTDQGVDWLPNSANTPVYAICPGTLTAVLPPGSSGWPGFGSNGGGTWLQYKITSGGMAGKCIYVAENINNFKPVGTSFTAGEQIATSQPGFAWTEWGWAKCAGTGQYGGPLTPYNGAPDGTQTAGGKAFCRFLQAMGAKCQDPPGTGPMYP